MPPFATIGREKSWNHSPFSVHDATGSRDRSFSFTRNTAHNFKKYFRRWLLPVTTNGAKKKTTLSLVCQVAKHVFTFPRTPPVRSHFYTMLLHVALLGHTHFPHISTPLFSHLSRTEPGYCTGTSCPAPGATRGTHFLHAQAPITHKFSYLFIGRDGRGK